MVHGGQLRRAGLPLPRPAHGHVRSLGRVCRSIRRTTSPPARAGWCVTDDEDLARIARSVRDWGRDCYCAGGENNTCGKRFSQQFGTLPHGYDHKYVYSHLGYNLKATDMQAAIGCAQLARLDGFIEARKRNHARLLEALRPYEDRLLLPCAAAHRPVVVLLRDHRARGRRVHAQRADGLPGGEPHRDAEPLQRQSAAAPCLRGDRPAGGGRPCG